jgi:hypothetical protein
METEFRRTSCESIDSGEEGSVLYFVRNPNPNNPVIQNADDAMFGTGELAYPPEELAVLVAA